MGLAQKYHAPSAISNVPKTTLLATTNPSSTPSQLPTTSPNLFPGEVTIYQNQPLTSIHSYMGILTLHPDVAIEGTQHIDKNTYKLSITGLVNNPLNYNYDDIINNFNSTTKVATLPCVEGWSVSMLWEGVLIGDLLQSVGGVTSNANTVIFIASDGYSSSLPLDYVRQNNIMIAYKMNNVTLMPETGWPFFLVAENQYGYKWVEWITEINVSNNLNYLGYWESRGYPNNATVIGSSGAVQLDGTFLFSVMAVLAVGISIVALVVYRFKVCRKNQV
jgi:DMSO/TMAO reductase YedYZ molybdopterin-dependent catalytic subunit